MAAPANRRQIALTSALHRLVYRASGGRLGSSMGKASVLLLTTTGRRSGKPRTTPLYYVRDGTNFAVVASNGGSDRDPAWWLNLKANPAAMVQAGRKHCKVLASVATAEEHDRLWPVLVITYPGYADYVAGTPRAIPVVILRDRPVE